MDAPAAARGQPVKFRREFLGLPTDVRICGPMYVFVRALDLEGRYTLPDMANRIRFSGLAAQLAALSILVTAACAAPTSVDGEQDDGPPPPLAENGSGNNVATGLAPGAGGSTATGGAAGEAGAGGAPGGGGATASGGAPATTTPGLEGAWNFEDVGVTTTKDQSGHAHHGVLAGSGVGIVNGGKVGSAASFSGGDGRVSITSNASLDFTTAATIELWVKLSSTTAGAIVARRGAGGDGVRIGTSQGNVQVSFTRLGIGSAIVTSDPGALSSGWTHLAVVNDGSTLKLYIDGKLHRTEIGGQLGYVNGDLLVGKSGTDSALNGYVDELKWWSVARTPQEICGDAAGAWNNGECTL